MPKITKIQVTHYPFGPEVKFTRADREWCYKLTPAQYMRLSRVVYRALIRDVGSMRPYLTSSIGWVWERNQ